MASLGALVSLPVIGVNDPSFEVQRGSREDLPIRTNEMVTRDFLHRLNEDFSVLTRRVREIGDSYAGFEERFNSLVRQVNVKALESHLECAELAKKVQEMEERRTIRYETLEAEVLSLQRRVALLETRLQANRRVPDAPPAPPRAVRPLKAAASPQSAAAASLRMQQRPPWGNG